MSVSVVLSVHNGGEVLRACLTSLAAHRAEISECIVVDDGSTDGAVRYAKEFGAKVIRIPRQSGPANGRNAGARAAIGDVVLFLDADVCVHPDTIARVRQRFAADSGLGALFGSYDASPGCVTLTSQFRNLLHCFVHQTGRRTASTFWAGCGAIRRRLFLDHDGFDVTFALPSVEDIEFGMRLVRGGARIELDPHIQVKHLKSWTYRNMIVTDIRQRGIPWTRLILESGQMPNDLNLGLSSRLSVIFAATLCVTAPAVASITARSAVWPMAVAWLCTLVALVGLNQRFYRFLAARRGYRFAAASIPLHFTYFLCCGIAFGLGVALHCRTRLGAKPVAAEMELEPDE